MTPLAQAAAAIDKQRFARALEPLLEVWAETRAPEIVALLDRVTARLTRGPVFPARANLETQHARWLAVAAARDPADVPRLLATVAAGAFAHACARIAVLATLPPDPRIARGLEELAAARPYGETTLDEAVTAAIGSHASTRAPRALDAGEHELLAALERSLGSAGEQLLAAVHAAPRDDGARAVYADWLLEHGDRHGELINAQLRGEPAPALVKKLERALVGLLIWKITSARDIRRGFLHRVVVTKSTARAIVAATSAPQWLTVEEIVLTTSVPPEWFAAPNLRNVRSVRGARPAIAGYLAHKRTPPLTLDVLGLDGDLGSLAMLVREPGALSQLHTLAIEGLAVPIADLAQSPLRALQRLEVVTMLSHVGRWLRSIETTAITELTITNDPTIVCVREPGESWLIDIPVVDWNANLAGNLAAGLAAVPDAAVTVANTDARYLDHVKRALAPLGDRVTYR